MSVDFPYRSLCKTLGGRRGLEGEQGRQALRSAKRGMNWARRDGHAGGRGGLGGRRMITSMADTQVKPGKTRDLAGRYVWNDGIAGD